MDRLLEQATPRRDEQDRPRYPMLESKPEGESKADARRRHERNRRARVEWRRFVDQRCARCGQSPLNVVHEPDPATSIEGSDYYADFLDELHPFEPVESSPEREGGE